MKFITNFIYPPIPIRIFDWSAQVEGQEGPEELIGFSATEAEAIDDLKEQLECLYD